MSTTIWKRCPRPWRSLARRCATCARALVIALLTVAEFLFGVFNGDVHMAEGMLIHQLSVLVVIANAMRLLRPRG